MLARLFSTTSSMFLAAGLCALVGCGSGDGGSSADAASEDNPCGFDSQQYLPYQSGFSWNYRVVDTGSGTSEEKAQNLVLETDPDLGEVIVQTTIKSTGKTISALKREGEAVLRLRQIDVDEAGVEERTTFYNPGQIRLDESADKLEAGATWDESYTVTVVENEVETMSARTDRWTVLGVDVECSSPFGDFSCVHVRRERIEGGVSDKQFLFARGVGKVEERNANQIEELVSCSAN